MCEGWGVQPGGKQGLPCGLLCGTSGKGELCMVPCHSFIFMGFGQAGAKRCGGCFKVINWGGNASHKRELFLQRKEVLTM